MRADRVARGAPARRRSRGRTRPPSATASTGRRDDRLASGPGLVRPRSASTRRWTGHRPVRPGVAAAPRGDAVGRAAARRDRGDAADRRRLRGRAVGQPAVAVRRSPATRPSPGRAGALTPSRDRRWTRARSPCSSSRSSGRGSPTPTSFPPSRRLAEALEPSDDPVIVARGLDETDQARALLEERPGVGIGGGARHRAGDRAGGPRRPPRARRSSSRSPTRSMRPRASRRRSPTSGGRCCATSGASSTRCRRCAARWRAASTRSASCSTRRRRGWAACARRSGSPTTGCAAGWTALVGAELGQRPPGADRHAAQRPLRRPGQGRGPRAGQGHRPRRLGQRPDAVHRAARRGRARQRLARGAGRRGGGDRPDPRRAVGARGRQRRRPCARRSTRSPGSTSGPPRRASPPRWTASGPRPPTGPRSSCCRRAIPGLTGRVVPIDIRLGDGYTALVVTGPNTGGKTVTLRTLGLLSLMHQAGLHVPAAAGSRLPVLRDVFADIGDEQSIAQSLSTFSGHLRSIIRDRRRGRARARSCCSTSSAPGTDPTEGSALAQALLDHFIRAGALVAATTHYAELKAYAHTTPGARNASVEFDLETLVADLPAHDRPARRQPGVRHRRAARACPRRSSTTPGRA